MNSVAKSNFNLDKSQAGHIYTQNKDEKFMKEQR